MKRGFTLASATEAYPLRGGQRRHLLPAPGAFGQGRLRRGGRERPRGGVGGRPPRALRLDTWIGEESGIDLCGTLRAAHPDTPVVFYSAAAFDSDREAALRAGACAYVTKPGTDELAEAVRCALGASRRSLYHSVRALQICQTERPACGAMDYRVMHY